MKCRSSNASLVAAWSFSSSETSPRQKSDESTSVGRKCVRANVDFPEPDAPTRTHEGERRGPWTRCGLAHAFSNTAICVGEPTSGSSGADGQEADAVPEAAGDLARPVLGTRPASTRTGGLDAGNDRPGARRSARCTRVFGVVTTTAPGRASPKSTRSKRRRRGDIQVLDHLDDGRGVEPGESPVAVGQRPSGRARHGHAAAVPAGRAAAVARRSREPGARCRHRRSRRTPDP